jgi:hypothetical protein
VSGVAHAFKDIAIILLLLPQFITISAKKLKTCPALNRVLNNATAISAAQESADL